MKKYVVVIKDYWTDKEALRTSPLDGMNEVFTFLAEQIDFSYTDKIDPYITCGYVKEPNVLSFHFRQHNVDGDKKMSVEVHEFIEKKRREW